VTALLNIIIAIGPVLLFLVALVVMDSFKLVRFSMVLRSVVVGCLAALAAFALNVVALEVFDIGVEELKEYVAPVAEELLKALYIVFLIRGHRVGFMVDAAIHGFAVGAGFAVVENIYYVHALDHGSIWVWVVRGFGTAMIHGSTTTVFAILSKGLADRHPRSLTWVFVPGLLLGVTVHSVFNHFLFNPLFFTGGVLLLLPVLVVATFELSERGTRQWMGVGLDTDAELLELITHNKISETHVGSYLKSLRESFSGPVLADLLCLLQVHLELSICAKGLLLARQAGVELPIDDETRAKLKELEFLERSVGQTGRLALHPFLRISSRELWQLYLLRK
jgi:RsiW-degrading membrane proteinase PrsW (M82 family)